VGSARYLPAFGPRAACNHPSSSWAHRPLTAISTPTAFLSLAPLRSLRSPAAFFGASIALLVGGLTHVVWDSFTHQSGYAVLRWPNLENPAFFLGNRGFELYEVLQDLSTLFGAAIVIIAYRQWVRGGEILRQAQAQEDDRWRYQLLAIIAIAALVAAAPFAYAVANRGRMNVVLFVVRLLIFSTTAFFTLLCAASIAVARRAGRSSD
jgi:hypothetical protein